MTLQKDQPSQDIKTHQQVTTFPPEVYNSALLSSIKGEPLPPVGKPGSTQEGVPQLPIHVCSDQLYDVV